MFVIIYNKKSPTTKANTKKKLFSFLFLLKNNSIHLFKLYQHIQI